MKNYTKPEVSVIQFGMTEAIAFDADNDDEIVVGGNGKFSENVGWWD